MKIDLIKVLAILAISILIAIAVNLSRKEPLSWKFTSTDIKAVADGGLELPGIVLEELKGFIDKKEGLVLDARPRSFYIVGHIPSALSFPAEDLNDSYAALESTLKEMKDRPLLIYCASRSCKDSGKVYKMLTEKGYTNIRVFKGGWVVWKQVGLPVEKK